MDEGSDEVLLESSPLQNYLQEIGVDSGRHVTSHCNFQKANVITHTEQPSIHYSNQDLLDRPLPSSYVIDVKTLLFEILASILLLEEHHSDLIGLIDALAIDVHPLTASPRPSWPIRMAQALPRWLTTFIPYLSTWTEQYELLSNLKDFLKMAEEKLLLWKQAYAYCQELALLSRGAVLINKFKGNITLGDGCIHLQQTMLKTLLKELENIKLCSSSLLRIPLSESVINVIPVVDLVTEPEMYAESGFDLNQLKITFNSVFVLTSQIVQRLGFVLLSNDLRHFKEALDTVSKHLQPWEELDALFKFQKRRLVDRLSYTGDKSARRQATQPKSALQIALHSLFLHSRELFLITNDIEEGNINVEDKTLEQAATAVESCKLCLDAVWKTRKSPQAANKLSLEPRKHISGENDAAQSSDTEQPITDEVYTALAIRDDSNIADPVDFTDEDVEQRIQYRQYVMRELRGVISTLSKETQLREERCLLLKDQSSAQNDVDGDKAIVLTAHQLAELTKTLIEGRDIRSLVSSTKQKVDTSDDDSGGDSAEELALPRSKCTVYTAEPDWGASCDESPPDGRREVMQNLASLVAARVSTRSIGHAPLEEECYMDDEEEQRG